MVSLVNVLEYDSAIVELRSVDGAPGPLPKAGTDPTCFDIVLLDGKVSEVEIVEEALVTWAVGDVDEAKEAVSVNEEDIPNDITKGEAVLRDAFAAVSLYDRGSL